MKAQDFDQNHERLHGVLREWKVETPLPPRFQEGVWRRIEHSETRAPAWRLLLSRFTTAVARPSLAVSYLAVLLLTGVLAGYWQARAANAQAEATLSARYVQVVDPYQNPNH